jgi:Flp pilus assembly pilin Flp
MKLFRKYFRDESGSTAIEYGVFVTILLFALISILGTGGALDGTYNKLTAINKALNGSVPTGQTQGQLQTQTGLVNQNHLPSDQVTESKDLTRERLVKHRQ